MAPRDQRLSVSSLADEVAPEPEVSTPSPPDASQASGLELDLDRFRGRTPGRAAKPPAPRRTRSGLQPIDWSQERQAARDVVRTDRGVWLVTRVVAALLGLRLAMRALDATEANHFTRFVGEVTAVLARPFSRFFEDIALGDGRVIEVSSFVALCSYFLIGAATARLLRK